jgi:hypothetical protein
MAEEYLMMVAINLGVSRLKLPDDMAVKLTVILLLRTDGQFVVHAEEA